MYYWYHWRWFLPMTVLGLATVLGATPAHAQEWGWQLRVTGVVMETSGDTRVSSGLDGAGVATNSSTGAGLGIAFERRINQRWGLDLALAGAAPEVNLRTGVFPDGAGTAGEVFFVTPFTVGFNYHITPGQPVDVYFGPLVAVVHYSEIDFDLGVWNHWFESGSSVEIVEDTDFTWGAQLGAGLRFGEGRWSLEVGVKYIKSSYQLDRHGDEDPMLTVSFDPTVWSLGFGYRFGR